MKIEQIYTGCLAQGAYYLESEGEAIIIDPLRETKPYLDILEKEGTTLKYILETHFHADFVSGHLDLAKATGASIVYGPNADTTYEIHSAKDGEEILFGKCSIKVLHTPGHTMESTVYLLRDPEGKDHAIFTGDTLFLGDVGRPDLAINREGITKEYLAGLLYDSLRGKIMTLGDDVIVYPAHGAGSACGKNLSKETWGYLGDQKQTNYALREDMTREEFIKEVTAGLLPPPQYFAYNARLNKDGYKSYDSVMKQGSVPLTPAEFERMANEMDALILDTRKAGEYAAGHIPNSIFIGIDGSFAPWVGALITDTDQPILIVAEDNREKEVIKRLSRVGYDNVIGYLKGGLRAWREQGMEMDIIESKPPESILNFSKETNIIDVRKTSEYLSRHLITAENVPLDFINQNMSKFEKEGSYALHCAGGYRSMIAASILKSRGFHNLINIEQGFKGIENVAGAPLSNFVCPTEMPQEVIDKAVEKVI